MNVGVSSCLLGTQCRYDGGHAHNDYIEEQLGRYFNLISFCPEAIVFGTPRDTIRLMEDKEGAICVEFGKTHQDITTTLYDISQKEALRVGEESLCGFIFKSKSPTYGIERVKVYQKDSGYSEKKGVGLFTSAVRERYPYLPIKIGLIFFKRNKGKTYNIIQHIFGYFSRAITTGKKEELLLAINEYKEGIIPLVTVIKMFNLYIKRFEIEYLAKQKFLHSLSP